MNSKKNKWNSGQTLIEFSLILMVLLGFIFVLVEAGRLFQGWITVQNSARSASRYAITGQFDTECLYEFPACLDPQVNSIKDEAVRTAAGLSIDPTAVAGDTRSLTTEVWGQDMNDAWRPDYAGARGKNVRVRVTYNMPLITPIPFLRTVKLAGQVVAVNEEGQQIVDSKISKDPPVPGDLGDTTVIPKADITISKTVTTKPDVNPGGPPSVYTVSPLDYKITVWNNGTFDAESVTLIDTLPAGSKYVGFTSNRPVICDPPQDPPAETASISCQLPNLAGDGGVDSSVEINILTVSPLEPANETVTNEVSVDSGPITVDPVPGNNSASAAAELIPHVDLEITKSDDHDPVDSGKPLNYLISVVNHGPNVAENVVVRDHLPVVNYVYTGATPSKGSCSLSGSDVVCSLGDLDDGESADVVISGYSPEGGTIHNEAEVSSSTHEDFVPDNSTAENTTVRPTADISVEKSGPQLVNDGDIFTYVITVTNNGPAAVPNVRMRDLLPVIPDKGLAVNYLSGSSGCPASSGSPVTCNIGLLPYPGSAVLTLQVQALQFGFTTNRARYLAVVNDEDSSNNIGTADTTIQAVADLSISKWADGPAIPGQRLKYTVRVDNSGPSTRSTAEDVVISDILDEFVVYPDGIIVSGCDSWTATSSSGAKELICIFDSVDEGGSREFTVDVLVDNAVRGLSNKIEYVTNQASIVSSGAIDPVSSNNSTAITTDIELGTDLAVTKEAPYRVDFGKEIEYSIKVSNLGPDDASNVQVVDQLPSLVSLDLVTADGVCASDSGKITCDFTEIKAGESEEIKVLVTGSQLGTAVNNVSVSSPLFEINPSNNSASAETIIALPEADLRVELDPADENIVAAQNENFSVSYHVHNDGPSEAENVVLTISTDVNPVKLNNATHSCNLSGSNIVCDLGTMSVGGPTTISVELSIDTADKSYTQSGSVTTSTTDPDPLNNFSSEGTITTTK